MHITPLRCRCFDLFNGISETWLDISQYVSMERLEVHRKMNVAIYLNPGRPVGDARSIQPIIVGPGESIHAVNDPLKINIGTIYMRRYVSSQKSILHDTHGFRLRKVTAYGKFILNIVMLQLHKILILKYIPYWYSNSFTKRPKPLFV